MSISYGVKTAQIPGERRVEVTAIFNSSQNSPVLSLAIPETVVKGYHQVHKFDEHGNSLPHPAGYGFDMEKVSVIRFLQFGLTVTYKIKEKMFTYSSPDVFFEAVMERPVFDQIEQMVEEIKKSSKKED